jgi:hypothetical protein
MIHFIHRLPIIDEIAIIKHYCLSQEDAERNPSSLPDYFAEKFYQQVIDSEKYSASFTNHLNARFVEGK